MSVASGGALSGTLAIGDAGTNHFSVGVSDAWAGEDEAALTITVINPTPPNPPFIQASLLGTNLQMQIASQSDYDYVLQATTNMIPPVVWTGVVTNSGTGGMILFCAPVSPTEPQQFYRVLAY